MPNYEYRCSACRRPVTRVTLRVSEPVAAACDHCGGHTLERLMSRFALGRSADRRLDDLCDDAAGLDSGDPTAEAGWLRRMGDELGEEAGADFDQLVDDVGRGAGDAGDDAD
jgi:putative FmdB family regulatory protein